MSQTQTIEMSARQLRTLMDSVPEGSNVIKFGTRNYYEVQAKRKGAEKFEIVISARKTDTSTMWTVTAPAGLIQAK